MLVYWHNQIISGFFIPKEGSEIYPYTLSYKLKHRLILQKIILAVLVIGTLTGAPVAAAAPKVKSETESVASLPLVAQVSNTSKATIAAKKLLDSEDVEVVVRSYFADTPILAEVARCESRFTQFNADGSIHQGVVNPSDIGVMQINRFYHLKEAKKLGIDLFTLEGNLSYAKHLYEEQGVQPWSASSPCWKKVAKLLEAQAKPKTDVKGSLATIAK